MSTSSLLPLPSPRFSFSFFLPSRPSLFSYPPNSLGILIQYLDHWFSSLVAYCSHLGNKNIVDAWVLFPGSDLIDVGCELGFGVLEAPKAILVCSHV